MRHGSVFLVDILVNAAGALVMVFLVFVSRQYSAQATAPPAASKAAVLEISVVVPGDALGDTLLGLCAPGGQCMDRPVYTPDADSLFDIPASGETDEALSFLSASTFGRPYVDTSSTGEGVLKLLFPCPVPGEGWTVALDYGTVFAMTEPTAHMVEMTAALRGADKASMTVEPSGVCEAPMSADTDAVCNWTITGEDGCGQ